MNVIRPLCQLVYISSRGVLHFFNWLPTSSELRDREHISQKDMKIIRIVTKVLHTFKEYNSRHKCFLTDKSTGTSYSVPPVPRAVFIQQNLIDKRFVSYRWDDRLHRCPGKEPSGPQLFSRTKSLTLKHYRTPRTPPAGLPFAIESKTTMNWISFASFK